MAAVDLDKKCKEQDVSPRKGQISDQTNNGNVVKASQVDFGQGDKPDMLDSLVNDSEKAYQDLAIKIVGITDRELNEQQNSKSELKSDLTKYFKDFLFVQYLFIIVMLLFKGSSDIAFELSDDVIIAYITSVFVETLGCVIFMVKYAFNSNQEVELIKILNNAITNYQKYHRYRTSNYKEQNKKSKQSINNEN